MIVDSYERVFERRLGVLQLFVLAEMVVISNSRRNFVLREDN